MKLTNKLAFIATNLAIFASTVAARPVLAAEFSLSGKFDGFLEGSSPFLDRLDYFDGTYVVSKLPTDAQVDLTSWNINLRDTTGNVVLSFNNSTTSTSAFIIPVDESTQLRFTSGLNELYLSFPGKFNGSGISDGGAFIINRPPGVFGFTIGRAITNATSQPVPEPESAGIVIIAGGAMLLIKRKFTQKKKLSPTRESSCVT